MVDNKKKCFIVSRIGDVDSDIRKHADSFFEHIVKPACEKLDFEPVRVDKLYSNDAINETILSLLKNSELVVADLTGNNPNVFFEVGYRHALNKPIVQMIDMTESIPFDLSYIRTIRYTTQVDDAKKASGSLAKTIENVMERTGSSLVLNESNNQPQEIDTLKKSFDALVETLSWSETV